MFGKEVVFFDLDGTITDSKEGIFASIKYALQQFGIFHPDEKTLELFLGPPLVPSFQKYYKMSEEEAAKALAFYREFYTEKGVHMLTMYEGADDMIKNLKKNGFTVCLATSKPKVYAEQIINRLKLTDYFDFLGGATLDKSRSDKHQVIAYILEQKQYEKSKIIMVGDRENDILGAKENGIDALGVLYGYGSKEELKNAGCTLFAKTIKELETILLKYRD